MPKLRANTVIVLLLLAVALTLVTGCASDEATPPSATSTSSPGSEPEATATELPEEPAGEIAAGEGEEASAADETEASAPTEEPTVEPTVEPTPEPTATPVVIVDADSACIECHTNSDILKSIAEEPEAVELSSGEG